MRRKKLKYIEDYIFAKSLNLLVKSTNVSRENIKKAPFLSKALDISKQLLEQSERQIKINKLNDISFLLLKEELESIKFNQDDEYKINKIKSMLTNINI